MSYLVDTNILLRMAQPQHPHSAHAQMAVSILKSRHETLNVAVQNIFEFWAVATRPQGENGLGMSTSEIDREISAMRRLFTLLPELPIFDEWQRLATKYAVSGKSTHDTRLVAVMAQQNIKSILTFNVRDFMRYDGIYVVDPRAVT